jgi:hypothetical protein
MDSFHSVSVNQGDFPVSVEFADGTGYDEVVLVFREAALKPGSFYLSFRDDSTDDAAEAGRRFAHWLEALAEHVRDQAHNRATRDHLELLADDQAPF